VSQKERLRGLMVELRAAERDLVADQERIALELADNRAKQREITQQLVTSPETTLRLPAVSSPQRARAILARLRVFTVGQAQTRVGWERAKLMTLFEKMLSEKPPTLEKAGRYEGQPTYRYVGPPIEVEPVAEPVATEYETIREWALKRKTKFSPGEAAAACGATRTATLDALRRLEKVGALVDKGPTWDHPLFAVADAGVPAGLEVVQLKAEEPEQEVWSRVPQIQEMLEAAHAAGLDITPTDDHFAVSDLEGRTVIVPATPKGRERMVRDRAALRRMGVTL
jgi:hypothetical protein